MVADVFLHADLPFPKSLPGRPAYHGAREMTEDFAAMQSALRESQGRVYSVNDAPMCAEGMCICDPRESGEVAEPRRDWWPVIALTVVCAGAVLFAWAASAAERSRPHDLWLLVKPTAIDPDEAARQRNIFKIGTGYRDHSACIAVKASMRKVAGTLQCLPSN